MLLLRRRWEWKPETAEVAVVEKGNCHQRVAAAAAAAALGNGCCRMVIRGGGGGVGTKRPPPREPPTVTTLVRRPKRYMATTVEREFVCGGGANGEEGRVQRESRRSRNGRHNRILCGSQAHQGGKKNSRQKSRFEFRGWSNRL